jgi:heat shock protein HslJ
LIRARITIPVVLLACLGLTACQQKKSETPRALEHAPARPDEFVLPPVYGAFRNMTVHGIENMPDSITLADGKWEDAASRKSVSLARDFVVVGDVCRDRNPPDAVVLLGASYGGTGDIIHLGVVSKWSGGVRNVATSVVGDRVQVRDARVDEDGRIVLQVVQAGPHDAMCCPGETAERIWTLDGGVLKEVPSTAPHGRLSVADLEGPVWLLHHWDGGEVTPNPITIKFQDGIVSGSSGCNTFHADVRTGRAPGDITFANVTHTLMACDAPKDSVETRFLSQLSGVTRFSFVATELALTYRVGDKIGTMLFIAPTM